MSEQSTPTKTLKRPRVDNDSPNEPLIECALPSPTKRVVDTTATDFQLDPETERNWFGNRLTIQAADRRIRHRMAKDSIMCGHGEDMKRIQGTRLHLQAEEWTENHCVKRVYTAKSGEQFKDYARKRPSSYELTPEVDKVEHVTNILKQAAVDVRNFNMVEKYKWDELMSISHFLNKTIMNTRLTDVDRHWHQRIKKLENKGAAAQDKKVINDSSNEVLGSKEGPGNDPKKEVRDSDDNMSRDICG